jgi:hypothetical protein
MRPFTRPLWMYKKDLTPFTGIYGTQRQTVTLKKALIQFK